MNDKIEQHTFKSLSKLVGLLDRIFLILSDIFNFRAEGKGHKQSQAEHSSFPAMATTIYTEKNLLNLQYIS